MRRKRIDTLLKKRYLNAKYPASYAGAYAFYDNLPDNLKKRTTRYKTLKVLQHIKTYCQNRPAPRRFKRRPIVVHGIDSQWAIDLADIPKLAKENRNVRFLFMCIDIFSKFGWIVPMKTKTAAETLNAFKKVIQDSGRHPKAIQIDNGTEYKGVFKRYCDSEDIKIFQVHSEIKSSVVERWIRTIMERVWRYMQHHNTFTYVDIIPKIVENYNATRHRSTKYAPKDINEMNAMEVWMNLYGDKELKGIGKPKFKIDDKVLISVVKGEYLKGYEKKFQDKVYVVDKISNTNPYMYYLKDLSGEPLDGGFYDRELSRIYI